MPDSPAVSARQREILLHVLSRYADVIETVGVFGSRATGRARDNSDIDLAIYGPITDKQVASLWTAFDESSLAVRVDVLAYHRIDHASLKSHIDRVMRPLFHKADLLVAA